MIHNIVDDVRMEGKYLYKGARKTNGNVNTFITSDKQAINMIAGAHHVLKALTQSMHLLKRTMSVVWVPVSNQHLQCLSKKILRQSN